MKGQTQGDPSPMAATTAGDPLAATQALSPPTAEERRFHHYEVDLRADGFGLLELGRGTMGVTYRARDVNLDTPVALKVINARFSHEPGVRERFRREARAAAQLRHPHVASVFHFGETPDGGCFYAMELIEGESLETRVRRAGPLPAARVVEIGLQVTSALLAAERQGLVHRDLKPANVMLALSGEEASFTAATAARPGSSMAASWSVKVIDFGLAKAISAPTAADNSSSSETTALPAASLTHGGEFMGTPLYASPEQFAGSPVDARSDIYSLGATLWFLLTGSAPFRGSSFQEIQHHQRHRPLPLTQLATARVPRRLAALLESMLANDPEKRPASPGALRDALEACREEIRSLPPASPGTSRRPLGGGTAGSRRQAAEKRRSVRARWLWGALAVALLGASIGSAYYYFQSAPSTSTQPTSPPAREPGANFADKSIAVLPLENLSDDKENAYFADGIQDDLLSSLARIKELKVISRSSVMGYRNVATRNLREISQQLGVSHVLEGSVRRTANRVLVNVALIATRTGQQIWAEHYDRALADSLTLQGELAREIAAALRATLSPEEKARVAAKPTENADAYVLYLRGREFQTRPTLLLGDLQAAENFYQQALALDPSFALAHARLSAALAYIYLNYQSSADLKTRARAAAEEALRLRPDGGEGSLARALCLYWVDKDYPAALRELEIAARLLPGNAEIDLYAGAIRRRQGLWREALVNMRRSLNRDPRAMLTAREIMITDFALRDWPAALRDGEYAVTCAPELPLLRVEKNWAHVWLSNDLGPLTADLAAVPAGVDPDGGITIARWDAALLARDFAAAERVVLAPHAPERVVSVFGPVLPRSYLRGCTLLARGESARAQEFFADARPAMEAEAREYPQDAFRQAQLGILYAYLGRKEDALRYARRAVELLPESKDALYGTCLAGLVALIQARAGETEQAITLLTRLLHTPGPVLAAFEGSVTQRELRLRWQWDPLRNDPRFQALVNGPEPATVY